MSYIQITNKQLISTVAMIIISIMMCFWLMKALTDYLDLPDVYVSTATGQCVKVVNYKNGDVFGCQDKDVTLRKYVVVRVQ